MSKCEVRKNINVVLDGKGEYESDGTVLDVSLRPKTVELLNDLSQKPQLPLVGTFKPETERSGPKRINGAIGVKLEIPLLLTKITVLDISVSIDLNGYAKICHHLDFYCDCPQPLCIDGSIGEQKLTVKLVNIFGSDEILKTADFTFKDIKFGNCKTHPGKLCCGPMEEELKYDDDDKFITIVKDVVNIQFEYKAKLKYRIYSQAKEKPKEQTGKKEALKKLKCKRNTFKETIGVGELGSTREESDNNAFFKFSQLLHKTLDKAESFIGQDCPGSCPAKIVTQNPNIINYTCITVYDAELRKYNTSYSCSIIAEAYCSNDKNNRKK